MGGDLKVSNSSTKTLTEVINFANEIYQRVLGKRDKHEEFVNMMPLFENAKHNALVKYRTAQSKYKNKPNSILSSARAEYNSAEKNYRYGEINVDVSGLSMQSEISYYEKMRGPASIAQNMLA